MYLQREVLITPQDAAVLQGRHSFGRYVVQYGSPILKIGLLLAVASPLSRLVARAFRCGLDAACLLEGFDTAYHLRFSLAVMAIAILAGFSHAGWRWARNRKRLQADIAAGRWLECSLNVGPRHLLVLDEDEPLFLMPAEGEGTRIFRVSPYRDDPRLEIIEATGAGDRIPSQWTWLRTVPSGAILRFEGAGPAIALNAPVLWDDCNALDGVDVAALEDGAVVPMPFENFEVAAG